MTQSKIKNKTKQKQTNKQTKNRKPIDTLNESVQVQQF